MEYLWIAISLLFGLGLGIFIGQLVVRFKFARVVSESEYLKAQLNTLPELQKELDRAKLSVAEANTSLSAARQQFESEKKLQEQAAQRELSMREESHAKELQLHEKRYLEQLNSRQQISDTQKTALEEKIAALVKQFEENRRETEKVWQAKIDLLKEEFKSLSEKILEEKSGKLQNFNKEQLEYILNPLKEKMTEFKTSVEDSKLKTTEINSALREQLEKMMNETQRIGGEARSLVSALKGEQKTQGDWGEMILEDILKRSGLKPGIHYECQETLRDDDGNALRNDASSRLMRPDVILHYPDGKDLVIDSKVSLTAYVDYMNAEDEAVRRDALTRHIRSVKSHVDELCRKNYAAYISRTGHEPVDFVVMFIPNEGPYNLAMISEPGLWNEAFKQKVMIVSPSNLMALLQLIHIAWTREEQDRNQQAILDTASQLLDRVYAFYELFDDVGKHLECAQKSYEQSIRRLKREEHAQSVVLSAEKLRKLGVKMSKSKTIPRRLQPDEDDEAALLNGTEVPKIETDASSPELFPASET